LARGGLSLLSLHVERLVVPQEHVPLGFLGPYPDNVVVLLMAGIVLGM
jgi:hypothetical protein